VVTLDGGGSGEPVSAQLVPSSVSAFPEWLEADANCLLGAYSDRSVEVRDLPHFIVLAQTIARPGALPRAYGFGTLLV
jgi:hypothetical protein